MGKSLNKEDAVAFLKNYDMHIKGTGMMPFHMLEGFLFAICSFPELIQPGDWFPVVLGDEPPLEDDMVAAEYFNAVMTLYNGINDDIRHGRFASVKTAVFKDDAMSNFEINCPMQQWSDGFSFCDDWLGKSFDEIFVEIRKEYGHKYDETFTDRMIGLMNLTVFSDEKWARERFEKYPDGSAFEDYVEEAVEYFNKDLKRYASFRLKLEDDLMKLNAKKPRRKDAPGRNDPCPCGSGKKYKKCCGMDA